MTNIFFISDTHFGHANICKFTRDDGLPLRPWNDINQMDLDFISKWNHKVGPNDLVYHLGDVVMNRNHISIVSRLNGRKRLVLGNHDTCTSDQYGQYFERVYGAHKFEDMWLTHIPVHEDSIFPRTNVNVHGHLHAKQIANPAYFNVSVELINFEPIALEELRSKIEVNKRKFSIDTRQKSAKLRARSQEL